MSAAHRTCEPSLQPEHTSIHEQTILHQSTDAVGPPAARDELAHYLIVIEGAQPQHMIRLGNAPLTIGRALESDIVLADEKLSRRHCSVQLVGDIAIVTDFRSTNGTFVDSRRVGGAATLPLGGSLQIGNHVLQLGRRSTREVEAAQALDRDLHRASGYVQSLLPAPMAAGPVLADWLFVPSAKLGGDALGYDKLDEQTYTGYIMDVAGHGAGAAMHCVSVMNLLRNRALPGVDLRQPERVVAALNTMFQMDSHGGLFFTLWYGVYDTVHRSLRYCSAGHHPAFVVDPGREQAQPLRTPNPAVGVAQGRAFQSDSIRVVAGSTLYLFSDGLYEITRSDGRPFALSDFMQLILEPPLAGVTEPQRLYDSVRRIARPGALEDDATVVVMKFP